MPLGPRRLSNRTAGASGLTPEEHAKCSERSEPRLFDALHIQRELFPRSCRGTLMMWAFFTGSPLACPSRCWSKGAGAFRMAQTSVPPSATGRTPNVRERPATTTASPGPCRSRLQAADLAGRDRGRQWSGVGLPRTRRRTGQCRCQYLLTSWLTTTLAKGMARSSGQSFRMGVTRLREACRAMGACG